MRAKSARVLIVTGVTCRNGGCARVSGNTIKGRGGVVALSNLFVVDQIVALAFSEAVLPLVRFENNGLGAPLYFDAETQACLTNIGQVNALTGQTAFGDYRVP